jgi:MFS family permease
MSSERPGREPWYSGITRYQWTVLVIASLGWIFDVYEGQIFVASMEEIMKDLLGPDSTPGQRTSAQHIANAAFLAGGALGGIVFGMLSDRIGRTRTMVLTILMYSLFTCCSALAQNWWQIAVLRFFVAVGVGGEWAVASAMVAEVMPKKARAWSLSIFHGSSVLGQLMAVGAGAFLVIDWGWRWVFVLGAAPALLTVWIRWRMEEPQQWVAAQKLGHADASRRTGRIGELFSPAWRRRTLVGVTLAAIGMATFWGVYVFGKNLALKQAESQVVARLQLPADLTGEARAAALKPHAKEIKNAEMLGMLFVTIGGGLGLTLFGTISERLGRRGAFVLYHVGGVTMGWLAFKVFAGASMPVLLPVLVVFGFFVAGPHGGYAVYFPELFPTRLRGTGAGFCFNAGRILAIPALILANYMVKDWGFGVEGTASLLSLLYLLGLVVLIWAPETRGKELPE